MKFKKPSKKSIKDNATLVGTAALGAMASDGVVGFIPKGDSLMVKIGVAAAAALAAASVSNSPVTKGLFAGMAVRQTQKVVQMVAQKSVNPETISNPKFKSFVKGTLGLKGSCNGGLNGVIEFDPFENVLPLQAQETYDVDYTELDFTA